MLCQLSYAGALNKITRTTKGYCFFLTKHRLSIVEYQMINI
ncbi:hypothetical protein A1OE_340 [Candidatus Endolissoclinum faulkneri L2]|uniref:Uncharacterized protein n=1 Tax=Candidatus Endolissoclinum faulkneri L2 TaxID=1193729 RepID=K7ZCF8_9PROT|nr:hypothetical protein A1OE_340 [Candidatus Endolissoclinum faulkneri L2]